LVNDPNNNGILDIGETIKVKCWVPASYWGITLGNERIMVWVFENDLSVNNGLWNGALARTNKGSGKQDWPASARAIVYECSNWKIISQNDYQNCRLGDCYTCTITSWGRTCNPKGSDIEYKTTKACY
jgi:hypothetical protein